MRGGRCRRQRVRQPQIPSVWPGGVVELTISLDAERALHIPHGEQIPELRTDSDDAGFERTQDGSAAPVRSELIIDITNQTNLQLLRQKL